jgi:hypothetical protein
MQLDKRDRAEFRMGILMDMLKWDLRCVNIRVALFISLSS